jgi:acetyl-CoA carboxylase carboxyltransferase component
MATPNFAYEATQPLMRRVQVGVVGSGDLEVLIESSNDGVVIAHGQLAGKSAVTMAIEGAFQGGSLGEVPASKIAGAPRL